MSAAEPLRLHGRHALPRPRLANLFPWLLRLQLLCVMSQHGTRKLDSGDLSVQELADMTPDMSGHVPDMAEHLTKAQDLFHAVGYDGPPELFSMYCCIFLSGGQRVQDADSLDVPQLIRAREAFTKRWGLPPHPVLLAIGDV